MFHFSISWIKASIKIGHQEKFVDQINRIIIKMPTSVSSPDQVQMAPRISHQAPAQVPKPQSRIPGIGIQLLTAGSAACFADLVTFPLDTVKVRQQIQSNVAFSQVE